MANPHRGEVELKAGDQTYTLVYTVNALCEAEEATGTNILGDFTKLSTLRLILWAGLQTKHSGMSRKDAGNIIGAAGVDVVQKAVTDALALAFPKREKGDKPENP